MRNVSEAYKKTMKQLIRPMTLFRGELEITDVKLKNEATVTSTAKADFSTNDVLADIHEYDYIALEPNFMRVGSNQQIIKPETDNYLSNGYVSSEMSNSNGAFTTYPVITMTFPKRELLGLSYQFVCDYPSVISVKTYLDNAVVQEYTSYPDSLNYTDPTKLEVCDKIVLTFKAMNAVNRRLRVARIIFGLVHKFDNSTLMKSEHISFVDPVSSSLSYKKLKIQLINFNKEFNPDNPTGIWRYFENNQPINIYYGVTVNEETGEVEWVQGDRLLLSNAPTTDSNSVTFEANDLITTLTEKYYKGMYAPNGKTLYELAETILQAANISEYALDNTLKTFKTKSPIPNLSYREILQLIANAGHCVFYCDSTGKITIESQLEPIVDVSDNSSLWYSEFKDAYNGTENYDYIRLEQDEFKLSEDNRFIIVPSYDKDYSGYKKIGYISQEMCSDIRTFETNPELTIQYSLPVTSYGFTIDFNKDDAAFPSDFIITFKNNNEIVYQKNVFDNNSAEYILEESIESFNIVTIEIIKMNMPYHRAEIRAINKGRVNDFYLDFSMSYDKPTVKLIDQVSDVNVIAYDYIVDSNIEEIATSEVDCNGVQQTAQLTYGAATNVTVSVENGTLVKSEMYAETGFITVNGSGKVNISVKGNSLITKERIATTKVYENGEPVKIDNPLISEISNAQSIANWIANYMKFRNSYETSIRQDFRLEANDAIYMKSDFEDMIASRVSKVTINLPGQQGSVTVRRLA